MTELTILVVVSLCDLLEQQYRRLTFLGQYVFKHCRILLSREVSWLSLGWKSCRVRKLSSYDADEAASLEKLRVLLPQRCMKYWHIVDVGIVQRFHIGPKYWCSEVQKH